MLFWASLFSTTAMFFGIPGTGGLLEFMDRLTPASEAQPARAIETSETMTSMRRFQTRMFHTRPTPAPTATQDKTGSVVEIIHSAAERHGLSGDYLVGIAECESGLDPGAYNASGYHGLFQFDQTTWAEFGNGSIDDPAAQAEAAASLIEAGQASRWPVCS
jgi:hypothetical protein